MIKIDLQAFRLQAHPVRIIPFDLGRQLDSMDQSRLTQYADERFLHKQNSPRQRSILKECFDSFSINAETDAYLYNTGIAVVVITEEPLDLSAHRDSFSIPYGENRKRAHSQLFRWEHHDSPAIREAIDEMRRIVRKHTKKDQSIRKSASVEFENQGLSYVMTLSLFDTPCGTAGFKNYPDWLRSNLYALLDPSLVYLEDSSKFETATDTGFNVERILREISFDVSPTDYERHRHIGTYMSWAAVVVVGQLQDTDKDEYTALEVQLQSDWFHVYCIEKNLNSEKKPSKQEIIAYQRQNYELDLLENRLYDFDDSSIPTRVLDIQRGLVETSGLDDSIEHAQRKIKYILEREQLESELRQKKLGQSSELLLFVIAFIEIAPTVAEYGNLLLPYAGTIANCVIVALGLFFTLRKR